MPRLSTHAATTMALGALALGAVACGPPHRFFASGGEGGVGGQGSAPTGAGGDDVVSQTSSLSSGSSVSSSSVTTTSGAGGGGGAGGAPPVVVSCLAGAELPELALQDPTMCIVALYDAPERFNFDANATFSRRPTWGRHGGPLTVVPSGADVVLERWQVPTAPTGTLTKQTTIAAAGIPTQGVALHNSAYDLPFFGWTALAYSNNDFQTAGEVVLVHGATVATRYPLFSVFSAVGVGSEVSGRLLHLGGGKLGDGAPSTYGFFAADTCGAAMAGRLVPAGDSSCAAPSVVGTWSSFNTNVVADRDGNVFMSMSDFNAGTASVQGFSASAIGRGAPPTQGDLIMTAAGFGSGLAAMAPTRDADGVVVSQSGSIAAPGAPTVVSCRYAVSAGKTIPVGAVSTLMTLSNESISPVLFTDDLGQLWAAVDSASGPGSRLVVIARRP